MDTMKEQNKCFNQEVRARLGLTGTLEEELKKASEDIDRMSSIVSMVNDDEIKINRNLKVRVLAEIISLYEE